MLGAASGAVAGLVAITPACGFVGPMGAIVIGLLAGLICLWGVNGLKRMLGADDSLDVFGVHGVGGILGALLTGVFASPSLGGTGVYDYVANKVNPDYSHRRPGLDPVPGRADHGGLVRRGGLHRLQDRRPGDRPARHRRGRARRPGHLSPRRNRLQPIRGMRCGDHPLPQLTETANSKSPLDVRPAALPPGPLFFRRPGW